MNSHDHIDLWKLLNDADLVKGKLPEDEVSAPWYVSTMLGAAGWLGALFLFGFVGVAFKLVIDSAAGLLIVGALCCFVAYALFSFVRKNIFVTQFGLALSLTGQAMFIFGLSKMGEPYFLVILALIFVFEALLAALAPNFIHRVISTWAAILALSMFLARLGVGPLAPVLPAIGLAFIWLNELRWVGHATLWQPIGYGLALSLVQIDASLLWRNGELWLMERGKNADWLFLHAPWIGRLVVALILIGAVAWLIKRDGVALKSQRGIALLAVTLLVTVLSLLAPGLSSALLLVLLGFAVGNLVLQGLGYVAFAGFLVYYYYQLDMTLLMKSMVLMGMGALLLLARAALLRWFSPLAEEHSHA